MFSLFGRQKNNDDLKLFYRTDIHSHLCPGIDDGVRSTGEAVPLLYGMEQLGIERMIVTPHVVDEIYPNSPDSIASSFALLRDAATAANISIELDYSAEYRIDELLQCRAAENALRPLSGGYLLVENPWIQEPFNLDSVLFELQNRTGLKLILAHPERYAYYANNMRRYMSLRDKGLLFQVNLLSLAGYYGKSVKHIAEWMLDNDIVDFVGSDMHHKGHLEAIKNYIGSKDYRKLMDKSHLIKNDIL